MPKKEDTFIDCVIASYKEKEEHMCVFSSTKDVNPNFSCMAEKCHANHKISLRGLIESRKIELL